MRHEAGRANARPDTAQRGSIHNALIAELREMIVEGRLAPAARINEGEISHAFKVSRTPLREALKVLAAEGLIDLIPNRGARVAVLGRADLIATFEVLAPLEGVAGELAATRITEPELDVIRKLQRDMTTAFAEQNLSGYSRANRVVHEAILTAARNPILARTYRSVSGRVLASRYSANLSRERWARALKEHDVILALLELRQPAELNQILRMHLMNKLDSLLAQDPPTASVINHGDDT